MHTRTLISQGPGRRMLPGRIFRRRAGVTTAAGQAFAPLIDARAAGRLLGVPHTWLLAQARAGLIPHHRLGHYVRFKADDLDAWLEENRLGPLPDRGRSAVR